ncbi:MAG: AsmA family protein [Gammaproteobacteria bacterium]|nr:AsmA family protein [Gammaproteobacteria bacterium]
MSKVIKSILWIIAILILIIVIGLTILVSVVDANQFKPIISKSVYQATGRQLHFAGDLHWSLWPLGIKVGETSLYSPNSFKQRDFISVTQASIHVNPLTIIMGHLNVSDLTINGLQVHLITTQAGNNNWTFSAPSDSEQKAQMADTTSTSSQSDKKDDDKPKLWWLNHGSLFVPELNVTNATIVWDNAKTNSYIKLSNMNIHAQNIRSQHAFPMSISVDVNNRQPDVNGTIKLKGDLAADFIKRHYRIANAALSANFTGKSLAPNGRISVNMLGDLAVTPDSFAFNDIKLNLDGTSQINGYARVDNFKTPDIAFDIKASQFNVDPYLAMINSLQREMPQAANKQQSNARGRAARQSEGLANVLRSLKLHGNIAIGQLTMAKANFQQVHIKMVGDNGVITIDPMQAKLYQGSYNGHFTIDARGHKPKLKVSESLQGVQVQPLLRDMYNFTKLTGSANIDGNGTAMGLTQQEILGSVNGDFKLALRNGSWIGTNIAYFPQVLLSMIKRSTPPPPSQSKRTDFAYLTSSGVIRNGVATTKDIKLVSSAIHVDGGGSTNLATTSVDMLLNATAMTNGMAADAKAVSPTLPIKVHGTWSDLKFSPQYQTILAQVAKGLIEDQLIGGVAGGTKQLGNVASGAGGVIGDIGGAVGQQISKLGGMFKGS